MRCHGKKDRSDAIVMSWTESRGVEGVISWRGGWSAAGVMSWR